MDERHSFAEQGENEYVILKSDPGIFSLSYYLCRELFQNKYDLAVNIGICGSFRSEYESGKVIRVQSDLFADIGTEDGRDLFEMGLLKRSDFPFSNGKIGDNPGDILNIPNEINPVNAITVNRVSTSDENISYLKTRYKPDIETMEGAMFFYICAMEKINYLQLRAVSNQVGVRDKTRWEIDKAMKAIKDVLKMMFS